MTERTNGRPGWRDVLHAVEQSETRMTKRIDKNRELIEGVDKRAKRLEDDAIAQRTERATIVKMVGLSRTVIGGVAGAIAAIIGMGFIG